MTKITKSIHTHAKGEAFGWWADAIHPAHLDSDGKLIPGTEWRRSIHNATTVELALAFLNHECEGLPT